MNGRDLARFQFDYDQTWAVMFLRADGTVLARYGARNSTDAMTLNSMAGLQSTMQAVLEVHRQWPQNESFYVAKRGPTPKYRYPEDMPSETIKKISNRGSDQRTKCIHCHNIYDAQRDLAIQAGDYDPRTRWKYPMPQRVGLDVDAVTGRRVQHVSAGSAAKQAGIRAGEEITVVNGQAIHSLADWQFVLHFLPEATELRVTTKSATDGERVRSLQLASGWRAGDIGWRASMYGMPPRPGLWVQAASDSEKSKLNISSDALALKVRGVFGRDVRQAGLKKGDVIVRFGDHNDHHSEGAFHAHLRLNFYQPNAALPLTVLRDGREQQLTVRFRQ